MEAPRPGRASLPAPHAPAGGHGGQGAVATHGAHSAAHEAHPSRAKIYVVVFVILFVVTALEVAVTYFPAIPQAPALIGMAVVKFFLIGAFFMHLRYDSRVFSAFFIIGMILAIGMLFSFLGLFTAHYREPFTPPAVEQSATGTTGSATATPTR